MSETITARSMTEADVQRAFNRSLIVRQAIIEKADRELPAGWREALGVDDEGEAA